MDCIEWDGTKDSHGYGVLKRDGKMIKAHRMVYEQTFGPIPDGIFVCHTCDNPPCVNPEHLFLGTPKDNVQDMIRKGRHRTPGAPRREFCVAGHPLSGDNVKEVKRKNGGVMRVCVTCSRRRAREYYHRKKNRLDIKPVSKKKGGK